MIHGDESHPMAGFKALCGVGLMVVGTGTAAVSDPPPTASAPVNSTTISGGITAICLALAGGYLAITGSRQRAKNAADNAERAKRDADEASERTNREARETSILKIAEAAAAAKRSIEDHEAEARLRLETEARRVRLALALEEDQKLAPTLKVKLAKSDEAVAKLSADLAAMEAKYAEVTDRLVVLIQASSDRAVKHADANGENIRVLAEELAKREAMAKGEVGTRAIVEETAERVRKIEDATVHVPDAIGGRP